MAKGNVVKSDNKEVYIPQTEDSAKVEENTDALGYVFVACCHPQGIKFLLQNGHKSIEIAGNAAHLRGKGMGILPVGGFGLTRVKAEDWEEIKATYGKMAIFKNGIIFAHQKRSDTTAEADEKMELRHGREPVIVDGKDKESKTTTVTAAV